jgi:peroxiredoxin
MRLSAVVMAMLLLLVGAAWGQDPERQPRVPSQPDPAPLPLTSTGAVRVANADLKPGDKVPGFRLDSSLGGVVRLADLQGHWSVLWFDESRTKLAPLGAVEDSLRALGVEVLGVCPDGVGALKAFAEREKIHFRLLSDPTREISQIFGMYDDGNQVIQPGLVIVDTHGIVRLMLQGPSPHADDLLQMVNHVLRGT